MTLQDLIEQHRPQLADESVGVRRSWEEMFRYTCKFYSADTPLAAFDLNGLASAMAAAGLHRPLIDGYLKRWRDLLDRVDDLQSHPPNSLFPSR